MTPASPVLLHNTLDLQEVVIAKDQPQYLPLPSIISVDGIVTTRWRVTWRERLRVVFSGSVWL